VRVAIDLQALQMDGIADRGIGRYVAAIAPELDRAGRLAAGLLSPELQPPAGLPAELAATGRVHYDGAATVRRLIGEYEAVVSELIQRLDGDNHALAVQIAALPEQIRGFGHVKEKSLGKVREREAKLLAAFRGPRLAASAAE